MKLKKLIAMLLVLTMALSLAACAAKPSEPSTDPEPDLPAETPVDDDTTNQPAVMPDDSADADKTPDDNSAPDDGTDAEEPIDDSVDAKLQAVLDTLLDGLDADFLPYYSSYPISGDSAAYAVGCDSLPDIIDSALAYGPMHGSTAFVMALFHVKDGESTRLLTTALEDANLVKWVCVEANYKQSAANGQLVLFLMANEEDCSTTLRDEIFDRFAAYDASSYDAS